MTLNFEALGVEQDLLDKLTEHEITQPSPVQAEAIPEIMKGQHVLARSQTGTGKTLAYLLPLLQAIDPQKKATQKLILAPSQELAMQIVREGQRYGEHRGIRVLGLIGGAAIKRQIEKLKDHPQLVVGTPGRVRELIASKKLKMHNITTIVIDEVDQMFQLGGAGDVTNILGSAQRDRQLVFLSATLNNEIQSLAQREMPDYVEIGIDPDQKTASGLEHYYFVSEERDKVDMLRRLVRHFNPRKALVFVNTTNAIGEIEAKLKHMGLTTASLYGDADKVTRSNVLARFREDKLKVLVASDVAARGLDIEGLEMVIHFDPATDSQAYVHRAGRTGRMGRKGLVVSVVTDRETFIMRKFSRELGIDIAERVLYGGRVVVPRPADAKRAPVRPSETRSNSNGTVTENRKTPVRTEAGRPGRNSVNGSAPGKSKGAALSKAGKAQRERDRKNKGAPRWLKEKGSKPNE
ncbi:DEAD/DEAH box helicase [Paenibacillus polymyxa]|uniref:DEAD/DEAH box helicase n=1 Tax=Paenibacillus polymyxa TaxID=1406 RepID=UPI0002F11AA2|nr:DEAD/DEAH box helicase [Paenibacillus polymyxa]MEB4780728.1 DEAD/DEAH box helicase [Paenibacillus jamilae]AIY08442.1 DEAD/DEAH box helicase [Paenibacillus polymyxa]MDN4079819.1 DEAD/DEAH box helicase [Paenibacillus polymyxa]MDN4105558.1 DEAD/DEAH box helicase [Paenibacillus polymyxa]MDN4115708.1 DEAD/DEAH box helicase [Paenibacillus polymyxa]